MLTNADCTVYHYYTDENGKTQYKRTVLSGVAWEDREARNIQTSGARDSDRCMIYIPFLVNAGGKRFLSAKQWQRSADKDNTWTLQTPGKTSAKIVKGVVEKELTDQYRPKDLEEEFDDVHTIMSVDTRDYGSCNMQHWEVSAK